MRLRRCWGCRWCTRESQAVCNRGGSFVSTGMGICWCRLSKACHATWLATPSIYGKSATTISTSATVASLWRSSVCIHRNPVKRGLCERPEDWEWSSFVNMPSGAKDESRLSVSGRQGVSERRGHSVQLSNCSTQAKRWLEWGTRQLVPSFLDMTGEDARRSITYSHSIVPGGLEVMS